MFEIFKAKEKFYIRHAILSRLKWKVDRKLIGKKDMNLSNTEIHKLAEELNIPHKKLYDYHHMMHNVGHIICTSHDNKHYIGLEEAGYVAVIEEYWLREGQKELNERIYDKSKWLVPLIALIATVGSILYSATKVQGMQEKVNKVQEELRNIRQQIKPAADISLLQGHRK